jgi:hypothetical protein
MKRNEEELSAITYDSLIARREELSRVPGSFAEEGEGRMRGSASIEIVRASNDEIEKLRTDHLRSFRCQIVHDSLLERGLTEAYLIFIDRVVAGYGLLSGANGEPKDTVREFHLLPAQRHSPTTLFRSLLEKTSAEWIETQTNDQLLLCMLFDFATALSSETVLFADAESTAHPLEEGVRFRPIANLDWETIFPHTRQPVGEWGLEMEGRIVATGGIIQHFNPPYGEIFAEVATPYRRRGFGRFLVQELKRICTERQLVPTARCRRENIAGRWCLERAGMIPCAHIIRGRVLPHRSIEKFLSPDEP